MLKMYKSQENNKDVVADAARELIGKRQWAEGLLVSVQAIRKSRGANRNRELSRLESKILLHMDPKNNEALIDAKVKEANIDFFNKLYKRFPQLTENEMLFCAYIRMNIDSTDIASLKGIDSKSVNMARYRLKKKLGIQQEKDLDEYLQSF